jgi:outer membrane protein TolC
LRRAEAEAEQTRSDLGVARELLAFLTGKTILSVRDDLDVPMTPKTKEELVSYVLGRADVLAAREAVTVAQKKVAVAQSGYWPSASVEGNSYTQKTTENTSDWDVTLKLSVPIFQGTETLGKVHEASARAMQAELELSETTRRALMEIRQAYVQWESAYNRVAALQKAVDAVEENYQLQTADYRLSMVNNLDVLQALEDLHDIRRDHIDATTDLKRFYWNFKVKTGDLKDVHL